MTTAVAPPPPKQFTDEELKQQYGIHLATRLQGDGEGKEAKWADIDDDEDDWAPDTVVWMDGTKSTLTTQEEASSLAQQTPSSPQPQKPAEGPRPTLAVKRTTELGPTKTILKPGLSTAAAQAKQTCATSTTPIGEPSKAGSPAPPSRSPWAALPPVEKVSPINPPVQQLQQLHQQPLRLATQDARAYELPLQQQPTREIAADTFDRSWREGEGGKRELFNSVSGGYEAVSTDGRRSSIRPDTSMRKPALLQRSSQSVTSPAEPSAAFQTRTANQMDGSYARRRGSSISQGSGPQIRRVSTSKGSDMSSAPERCGSIVAGHDIRASPQMARTEPAQPAFSQQSAWQQQMPARPEAGPPVPEAEDPVKVQERVMREKRERGELAKKRRDEEEQRMETEKQERLKARLAQLEGAGKSRAEREAEAAATPPATTPTPATEKPSEVTAPTLKPADTQTQPSQPAEVAPTTAPALEAQSVPAPPAAPQPRQTNSEDSLPSPLPPKPHFTNLPERPTSSSDQQRQPPRAHLSPRINARGPFQAQPSPYGQPASSYSSPGDRKQQQFGRSPMPNNDTFSPWPTTASHGNVWGTSGIGNGTFENSSMFAPMQQTSALPPPPGMTRPSTSNRISPQSHGQDSRSPSMQQQALAESHRGFAPPGFEPRPDAFAHQVRTNGASPVPGHVRQPHPPGPIGPPSRAQAQPPVQQDEKLKAWTRAAENLPQQYRSDAEAAGKPRQTQAPSAPADNTIKETFKKTSTNQKLGAPRKYEETEYTIHDRTGSRTVETLSPAPPAAQTQPTGPGSAASPAHQDPWMKAGENKVRLPDGSLNAAHGGTPAQQPPIGPPSTQQSQYAAAQGLRNQDTGFSSTPFSMDSSPPPPDSLSHPVNNGDTAHPMVRLPPGKPKVRLPPAPVHATELNGAPPQQSLMMPMRPISNLGAPGSSRPIVAQQAWQERFNVLFHRTAIHTEVPPSPPKTPPKMQSPALAVAASSRTVMDEMPAATGAMVSLPQAKRMTSPEGFTIDDSDDVVSKPTMEQMFTEELSFGSKPAVKVPRNAYYNQALYHRDAPRMVTGSIPGLNVDAHSVRPFDLLSVHHRSQGGIYVGLPQLNIRSHLVHHNRPGKGYGGVKNNDRRPSGRFNNHKAGNTTAHAHAPATSSAQQNGVKTEATPSQGAPAATPAPANDSRKKSSTWNKGPRNGPPRNGAHVQQAQPVQW